MGDVSLNQTIERPPCSIAKGDQVRDLVSVGWTNESHSMYISSMEASFMQQLHGHEHHAPDRNRSHVGADGVKLIQEGAMDGLISQKNDSRSRDIGVRCLPENPWTRRFKPRSSGANRRGDGVGASVDDGESGTDTVQERIPTHVRDLKSCVGENLVDKSSEVCGQNFLDEEVQSTAEPSKSYKKRRPTPSTAAGFSILKLAGSDKRW
ncbi:cold-regulated protein 27-like [Lolium rigidum]|uniref:cold-regulated protein 27-like n=1 Tax=Lolium rigidum TaxID=89674 RepID=UPI001F5D162E|nr:cold-regulated protein 27-like [Lolium rigidum]